MNWIREFPRELWRRNRVLAATGWLHVALLCIAVVLMLIDSRTILGISPWIKPMKFMMSITIYLWTVAWFIGYLTRPRWLLHVVSGGVALAMIVEIVCIVLQSARGTTSHFNNTTPFDAAVFSTMGAFIAFNTVLAVLLLLLFLVSRPALPSLYLWGIRLGLLVFIAGSSQGGMMVQNRAHAVGVDDGGPGLPFVNWSVEAGDLRIAHFFGIHALQIIPIAGFLLSRAKTPSVFVRHVVLFAFAGVYGGTFAFILWWALTGRPLIPL